MFTGIIEKVGTIIATSPKELVIDVLPDIELGDSIAVNGVCLTVTHFDTKSFSVDIMPETRQQLNSTKASFISNTEDKTPLGS